MRIGRSARCILLAAGVLALGFVSMARAEVDPFRPENIEQWIKDLGWRCTFKATCPVPEPMMNLIKRAIAHERDAQYLVGLNLSLAADGFPGDRQAGVRWIILAAEQGEPSAAMDIARQLRNGASFNVDETKIANALRPQAEKGDLPSMRALAPMIIGGRGTKQDAAAGLAMLKAAADKGSTEAERDLSQIYMNGAPGIPANRPEAMRWLGVSARHGNVDAMFSVGYMAMTAPIKTKDVAEGYCWIVRAAMLDHKPAQEKLTNVFTLGEEDDRGVAIAADLAQADLWLRLAAQSPYHDNSQMRARIEPSMTTEQLDAVKSQVAAWKPKKFEELKALTIPLPGGAGRNCAPF